MLPWLMTACIYPCVVGPDFWGLVNRDWRMCTAGQMQSPVNIDPAQLLFDPHLGRISVDDVNVEATFENIGQLPIITIDDVLSKTSINITGGPALPYRYRLHQISVHFGHPDGERGSEHTVDRVRFPAEVQLLAYNIDLYTNYSQAITQPRGLLAISVIVDIGSTTEVALRRLTVASQSITYKGMRTVLRLNPAGLLPRTTQYVTYEGSLTIPGCHETVTWIIMNNPIYITRDDLQIWNELQKTESKQPDPAYMTPVYRPLKALNGRLLRTNINLSYKQFSSPSCSSNIYTEMGYRSNPARSLNNQSITRRSTPVNHLRRNEFSNWIISSQMRIST
ncbi:putative carbonic anhydrase-like protein 2 [Parelaphostrongylus tenuis]|uniref:Carbonic anhydrase-like protein 2 n=1 Tax=Parelaphostrongylus tenuis TaxID=148309 RepID=A0AAD5MGW1_PARTN|nr:putative carbonic anhydrase-like protein 2 [Parelaphostrongylus tenuis]